MAAIPSRFLERFAVSLLGGLALAAASAVGFWAGSLGRLDPGKAVGAGVARPTADRDGPGLDLDAQPADGPDAHPAAATRARRERRRPAEADEKDDDPAVFVALERLERHLAAGMNRARDSVVALEYSAVEGPPGSRRLATGVVINASGDTLSVRIDPPAAAGRGPSAAILARDTTGRRHAVQWVASDPETGLTLLRIPPQAVRPILMAGESPVLGSQVFVVGNPFGLGHSVSRGHVAGLDRALKLGERQVGGLLQVQAPLYPGDSGAVVTNLRGQLLGLIRSGLAIPTAKGGHDERDNDFGFAIGTRDLLWVADQLRARGRVDRAYLGVHLQSSPGVDPPADGEAGLDGAYLQDVVSGSPAATAGLQSGDAVVGLNGEPIRSTPDLTDRLDRLPARATVRLDVLRGSGPARQPLRFVVQSTSRPDAATPRAPAPAAPARGEPGRPAVQVAGAARPPADPGRPNLDARTTSSRGPLTIVPTAAPAPTPPAEAPPGSRSDPVKAEGPPRDVPQSPPAVSIPPSARSPLRTPVQPARAEDLKLTLPGVVTERLEQLERRLEKLERQGGPEAAEEARKP